MELAKIYISLELLVMKYNLVNLCMCTKVSIYENIQNRIKKTDNVNDLNLYIAP